MKWIVEDMYGKSRSFAGLEAAKRYAKDQSKETDLDHYVYECRVVEYFKGAA